MLNSTSPFWTILSFVILVMTVMFAVFWLSNNISNNNISNKHNINIVSTHENNNINKVNNETNNIKITKNKEENKQIKIEKDIAKPKELWTDIVFWFKLILHFIFKVFVFLLKLIIFLILIYLLILSWYTLYYYFTLYLFFLKHKEIKKYYNIIAKEIKNNIKFLNNWFFSDKNKKQIEIKNEDGKFDFLSIKNWKNIKIEIDKEFYNTFLKEKLANWDKKYISKEFCFYNMLLIWKLNNLVKTENLIKWYEKFIIELLYKTKKLILEEEFHYKKNSLFNLVDGNIKLNDEDISFKKKFNSFTEKLEKYNKITK